MWSISLERKPPLLFAYSLKVIWVGFGIAD
jgi:hypothetical protein